MRRVQGRRQATRLTCSDSVVHDGDMPGPQLTETLQVRMRPEEKAALERVALHYERTPSEMVRRFIRKESRRLEARKKDNHGSEKK